MPLVLLPWTPAELTLTRWVFLAAAATVPGTSRVASSSDPRTTASVCQVRI